MRHDSTTWSTRHSFVIEYNAATVATKKQSRLVCDSGSSVQHVRTEVAAHQDWNAIQRMCTRLRDGRVSDRQDRQSGTYCKTWREHRPR
jgi:hypothetical protein